VELLNDQKNHILENFVTNDRVEIMLCLQQSYYSSQWNTR